MNYIDELLLKAFETWCEDVDGQMQAVYGISWNDASGDLEPLRDGFDSGQSPAEFVERWGTKYDLDPVSGWGI